MIEETPLLSSVTPPLLSTLPSSFLYKILYVKLLSIHFCYHTLLGEKKTKSSAEILPASCYPFRYIEIQIKGRAQTFSVMMPDIKLAGVTSKAGFQTAIPDAATCSPSPPRVYNNSFGDLSSITISCPDERDKSMEVRGAATKNGTL